MKSSQTSQKRSNLLIDGNSIAWRAYHVSTSLSHKGDKTGMAFVFLRMLHSIVNEIDPMSVLISWDFGKSFFRTLLYPEYKQHRPRNDETKLDYDYFSKQKSWLSDKLLPRLKVGQVHSQGWEADDLVAYHSIHRPGPHVIFSGDRDLWQLMNDQVKILCPTNGLVSVETMNKFCSSSTPNQLLLRKILSGDPSDNISGLGGIGKKRVDIIINELVQNEVPDSLMLSPGALLASSEFLRNVMTPEKEAIFNRNFKLMSLKLSSDFLKKRIAKNKTKLVYWGTGWDDQIALELILESGMNAIAATWSSWVIPFHRLNEVMG